MSLLTSIIQRIEERPEAILIIGAPGSGKTHWSSNFIKENKSENYVDLNITNFLDTGERSDKLEECVSGKKSFIFEGIALKEDRFRSLFIRLQENGYRTCLVYINRDIKFILENSDNMPEKTLLKLRDKNKSFFDKFKDNFDKTIEVTE